MKKMFRRLALILVLSLLAAGILGCGSDGTGSSAASSGSTSSITINVSSEEAGSETPEADPADSEMADSEAADSEAAAFADADSADADSADVLSEAGETAADEMLDENGTYDSKEDVALYLHQYGKLPSNYITKKEAQKLGWSGGSVEQYAEGKCIGGSYFGNNEGILPDGSYHECDIDTLGASSRGAKRIVYSDDGNIYYTEDHYETFTLLYTAEGPSDGSLVYK